MCHTVSAQYSDRDSCQRYVSDQQLDHMVSRGWQDVGYNYMICGNGDVYQGRGSNVMGSHTYGVNWISIGIAFIGHYGLNETRLTPPQIDNARSLLRALLQAGKLTRDYHLIGSGAVNGYDSPGKNVLEVIREWEHYQEKINVEDLSRAITAAKRKIEKDEDDPCWSRFKKRLFATGPKERAAICLFAAILLAFILTSVVFGIQLVVNTSRDNEMETTTVPSITSPPYYCMVSRRIWTDRPAARVIPDTDRSLSLAVITHTGTPGCHNSQECVMTIKHAQTYHMDFLDYEDIAYNFLVGGDGYVYVGRGWGKQGAHTYGVNNITVGIAFVGNYHNKYPNYDTPTPDQIRCTHELLEQGISLGWLSQDYSVVGHCDILESIPPGNVLMEEIRSWPHYRKEGNPGKCLDDL